MRDKYVPVFLLCFASFQIFGDIKIATYNINYSRSAENEWKWPKRKNDVFKTIRHVNADILSLQEVVKSNLTKQADSEVSYEDLKTYLSTLGYRVFEGRFAGGRPGIEQYFFTAIKKDLWAGGTQSRTYKFNTLIKNPKLKMMLGSTLVVPLKISGKTLLVFNHHFPMDSSCRLAQSKVLKKLERKALEDFKIRPNMKNLMVVHLGDFNSFPDRGGAEQVQNIVRAGYIDTGTKARWSNSKTPVNGRQPTKDVPVTFVGFPHDIERMAKKGISFSDSKGHLDHIFYSKNMALKNKSVTVWNNFPKTVSYHYTHWNSGGEQQTTIFPSDHLPLSAAFRLE